LIGRDAKAHAELQTIIDEAKYKMQAIGIFPNKDSKQKKSKGPRHSRNKT